MLIIPRRMLYVVVFTVLAALLLFVGCSSTIERSMLFHPTHHADSKGLQSWKDENGATIGLVRNERAPKAVWLLLHGNSGQAADRVYALPRFAAGDTVYIMEYPGFGLRPGKPSRTSFDAAAEAAYRLVRKTHPDLPVCVAGESIGTGPASHLGTLPQSPDKIVLLTPFARLAEVARGHVPGLLVALALKSDWDNVASLAKYRGPVEIYGARADLVIPVQQAQALAAAVPGAKITIVEGGHNDWAQHPRVVIAYP